MATHARTHNVAGLSALVGVHARNFACFGELTYSLVKLSMIMSENKFINGLMDTSKSSSALKELDCACLNIYYSFNRL